MEWFMRVFLQMHLMQGGCASAFWAFYVDPDFIFLTLQRDSPSGKRPNNPSSCAWPFSSVPWFYFSEVFPVAGNIHPFTQHHDKTGKRVPIWVQSLPRKVCSTFLASIGPGVLQLGLLETRHFLSMLACSFPLSNV